MTEVQILRPGCDDDDDDGEGERGKRGKRGKRGHRGFSGPLALKWSGLVEADLEGSVTRNLADPGTNVASAELVENRYPFALAHKAVGFAVRTSLNTLTVAGATVSLLKNGVVFATVLAPAAGVTTVVALPDVPFAPGDDIEVQVLLPQGLGQDPGVLELTVVVELT